MYDKCEKVVDKLKPLVFTLGEGDEAQTYEVPPSQYMIEEYDKRMDFTTCHLAVIGQVYMEQLDHWILGESFMQGFYIAFNADDNDSPKVGLSQEGYN